uniref:CBM20 domain-containing protein n=1 Tax=Heterorhabditis bacteriophora TaxID=37862 RepID=A0A1I7WBL5_HETBA
MASSPRMTRVHFAVDVDSLYPPEFVMVTGSVQDLGKWDPQKGLMLIPDVDRP